MVRAYVHDRKGLMVDLPDNLLLAPFQVRLTSIPPLVKIYPADGLWKGSVEVEQYFPFTEDIVIQYKATPTNGVKIPESAKYDKKQGIERLIAEALANPRIRIGLKDSHDPHFDQGDIEGDPDDWSKLNTCLWITIEGGRLARLQARERYGKDDNTMYGAVLTHFTGSHYTGRLSPENIGRLTTQEVIDDVLGKLVLAVEIKAGLRDPVPK